jgi:hypothetical protein
MALPVGDAITYVFNLKGSVMINFTRCAWCRTWVRPLSIRCDRLRTNTSLSDRAPRHVSGRCRR